MHNFQMISYALPFFFQALFSVIRYILSYGESNVYRRMYQRYKIEKVVECTAQGALRSETEKNHVRNSYGRHGT